MMLNPPFGWPVGGEGMTAEEVQREILKNPQSNVNGDYETLRLHPLYQDTDGKWTFWCDAWKHGRCSIYDHRPSMCRTYEPQSDILCWHHDETTAYSRERPEPKGEYVDLFGPTQRDSRQAKEVDP